ncbi:alginate lyase family protein [Granulicella sp. 5B5]|uniref:alginate lyase family protein n=1 Tax=Granulicella sp. 5B5 TaxID=1617967 RepID=UPI0015F3E3AE|nr:alginate lyase family protein [Granulicella sp. 5B5]
MPVLRRVVLLIWMAVFVRAAWGQAMQHPGVLVSGTQLAYVRAQIKAKQEPFYSEYQKAVASEYGALDYKRKGPPADGVIDCGPYSHPDNGCHAEDSDASAAYLQALLWNLTGDHRYAENAIRIVNAYAKTVKAYANSNQPLQAAWSDEVWPRAGELLRYSHSGWKPKDIAAFTKMLTKVNLPEIYNGSGGNGNWELSMIDAMMGIAVFTNDRPLLQHAEGLWRERVPAYFYNFELDGPHPRPVPRRAPPRKDNDVNWYGTTDLNASVDGMAQETCRDLGHTGYGIAATTYAAETARIQGDKLFEAEEKRLVPALEFHARLYLRQDPVPALVCGGKVKPGNGYTFAVGYAEYHDRLGVDLPETKLWLEHVEQQPVPVDIHMMVFEPLTDAKAAPATGN